MKRNWSQFLTGSFKATRHGIPMRAKHWMARKHREAFERAKQMTVEEFHAHQRAALAERLLHAVEHVPYYRAHRDDYVRSGRPLRLEELPVLAKSTVRERAGQFHADSGVGRYRVASTSGTTGSPLVIHESYRTHSLFQAGLRRHRESFGIRPFRRVAALTGFFRPATATGEQIWWRDYIGNRLFLSTYQISDARIGEYAELLAKFRPEAVVGYASTVYMLAATLRRNDLAAPESIKAAFTTSEVLYPHWRQCVEEVFRAPVGDHYSSLEAQCLVTQCPAGSMHINPELGIVEVVDENLNPSPLGEEGDLLVSGIASDAMPLFRYKLGDRAARLEEDAPCPCGLRWPCITPIVGRSEDAIVVPDGRAIMYLNFHCTKNVPGIIESQFIQDAPDHIRVLLVKDQTFGPNNEKTIRDEIRRRAQFDFRIDVEYVDQITRGPRGKFRAVVNLLGKSEPGSA